MAEKIEEFLFDILGLIVPGIVSISLAILLPLSVIDYSQVNFSEYLIGRTPVVTYFSRIIDKVTLGAFLSSWQVILILIIISYIFGHTIKVLAKIQYELCSKVFDQGFNNFFRLLSNVISDNAIKWKYTKIFSKVYRKELINSDKWYTGLLQGIIGFWDYFMAKVRSIFTFSAASNYEPKMQELVAKLIKSRYEYNPDGWYSIYKFANIIIAQEKLESLSFNFLAKYNFYRSLALIFLLNGIYILVLYGRFSSIINPLGHVLFSSILFIDFILWFTFHEKYKRYWTLCGNESLVALFYFLTTKGKEQKQDA